MKHKERKVIDDGQGIAVYSSLDLTVREDWHSF